MATAALASVLQHLRTLASTQASEDTSDRELLAGDIPAAGPQSRLDPQAGVGGQLAARRGPSAAGPDGQPLTGVTIDFDREKLSSPQFTLHALDPEKRQPFFFHHREKNLAAAVLLTGDEPEGFTVRLRPAATVTGRLLDEDGLPMAETGIMGEIKPGPYNPHGDHGGFWGKTDKEGRFRIEGLVPGIAVAANIQHNKPVNNSVIGPQVFDQLTFKPGEVRDLGDIRIK